MLIQLATDGQYLGLKELYHEMNIFLRLIIINSYFLYMR
jgi:hypothetical protein